MSSLIKDFGMKRACAAVICGIGVSLLAPATGLAQSHAPIPVWQGAEATKDQAIALHNQGYAYARLGYFTPAIEAYDEAIALAPSWASAYANRAMAYRAIGESEKALQDVATSIALDDAMVRKWQEWMVSFGLYDGAVDGVNGPRTQQALNAWVGLPPMGPLGDRAENAPVQ